MRISEYFEKIACELNNTINDMALEEAERLVELILKTKRVFVLGAGRSGFMLKSFAMRLAQMGFEAYVIGETITTAMEENDLLVIGSGSGETESLVAMALKAKKIKGIIALITIYPQSSIGLIADLSIKVKAVSSKVKSTNQYCSIQPGASLFEISLLILLESIVLRLMEKSGKDSDAMFTRHANIE